MNDVVSSGDNALRIGISSRALFALEEEHLQFEKFGPAAYMELQRRRAGTPLRPGAGFAVIRRLLALNVEFDEPKVEVVILSRSPPPLALRIFKGVEDHGLRISTGSFTCGRSVASFAVAWGVDLFLSNEDLDVRSALSAGIAAARLGETPTCPVDDRNGEVRIALDADSVVFGPESDQVFLRDGLEAFHRHEIDRRDVPLEAGPFGSFFRKLAALRSRMSAAGRIRIAIVTARSAPAHARIIRTLESWDTEIDEIHFVGSGEKSAIVAAFGAHVFFDDNLRHVASAASLVPTGHVPVS